MGLRHLSRCILPAVALGGLILATPLNAQDRIWHTRPDKWKEPRNFQTPFLERYQQRIVIHHVSPSPDSKVKILSYNNAYWFGINPDWNPERPSEKCVRFHIDASDAQIRIFSERDQQTEIVFKDHYPNFQITAAWVSEKLLFIRVWWGGVLGTDMIFDVEKESFIYREMVNDGGIPFIQWQGQKNR